MNLLSKTKIGFISLGLTLIACSPESTQTASQNSNQTTSTDPVVSERLDSENLTIANIELSNPSSFARKDEGVYLSFYELGIENSADYYAVKTMNKTIPTNVIDKDGDGTKDGIFFVVDIASEENMSLQLDKTDQAPTIEKRTQAEISHKIDGQWEEQVYKGGTFKNVDHITLPPQYTDHSEWIRYEGPGIESDLIGYRVYLDWRNGFDIFGKTAPSMVLQNVGQDGYDSYHEPADWGMDLLKVGDALGIGGYGYWDGEKAIRVSDVETWQVDITNNSPLQSSFKIQYGNWKPSDSLSTDLSAQLTMHAGQRWIEVEVTSSNKLPNLLTGVVRHPNTEVLKGDLNITGKAWTYLGTYGAQSLDEGKLGMAVLVQNGSIKEITSDSLNEVAVLNPTQLPPSESGPAQKIHYYLLSAWDKEPNSIVDTKEDFENYLKQTAERLTLPLRIKVKSNLTVGYLEKKINANDLNETTPLTVAKQLADSEIIRKPTMYAHDGFDVERGRPAFFEYTTGLLMQSFSQLSKVTDENKYRDLAYDVVSSFVNDDGMIYGYNKDNYNIDSINTGRMVIELHQLSQQIQFRYAADTLREQLEEHPRTSEGAFWHKKRYPHQVWLDGVYMGLPFLAEYESLYSGEPNYSEIINEFKLVEKYLKDEKTGLFYHGWDEQKQQEWANSETGLSPYFWGRGLGWYSMALVDVLDYIPQEDSESRQILISQIQDLAQTLVKFQDSDSHTWYQILDKANAPGNYLEASASSMFTYFFAKAVNNNYLDDEYKETAIASYQGLLNNFIEVHADDTISLTDICFVAGLGYGRDGSYRYYMSEPIIKDDPKGVGPFILASVETHKLLSNKNTDS